jgi:hypothetical protein
MHENEGEGGMWTLTRDGVLAQGPNPGSILEEEEGDGHEQDGNRAEDRPCDTGVEGGVHLNEQREVRSALFHGLQSH